MVLCLIALEVAMYLFVKSSRKHFPWLITPDDFYPIIDKNSLEKFCEFGFDAELGWIRKPKTGKTEIGKGGIHTHFSIDSNGSRVNPGHEGLASGVVCLYGDSFAFSRQVNDDETLQWHLSEQLGLNVQNFAVGNYGLDQALLRFKRENSSFPFKVTIFGVVPSTIVRIHDIWKHYNEFGNIYGFKPRFKLDDKGTLVLLPNLMTGLEAIKNYKTFLPQIQKDDIFYKRKFLQEMIRFPYLLHILAQPKRNFSLLYLITKERIKKNEMADCKKPYSLPMKVIMDVNLKLRCKMFLKKEPVALLKAITLRIIQECEESGSTPLILWMPQKDDVQYIQKTGKCFYESYTNWAKNQLTFVDMTECLLAASDLDALYCDDTAYGGHFTGFMNKITAEAVRSHLEIISQAQIKDRGGGGGNKI
jgi:hypothetical protein